MSARKLNKFSQKRKSVPIEKYDEEEIVGGTKMKALDFDCNGCDFYNYIISWVL